MVDIRAPQKPLNQIIEGYNDKLVVNTSGLELGKHMERPKIAMPHLSVSKYVPPVRRRTHTLEDHKDEV